MPADLRPYLLLAQRLLAGEIPETHLTQRAAGLPSPDSETLDRLGDESDKASRSQPRLAWAIAAAGDAAARHTNDPYLQALAAWHLARACNTWVRPARVTAALARARAGFQTLDHPGWLAACDWLEYALPWTRNDFARAAEKLAAALQTMQATSLDAWLPHCRMSLAYALILQNQYPQACSHLDICEQHFIAHGDELNRARLWLHRASALRRQTHLHEALEYLHKAEALFEKASAALDLAKTYFQIACCQVDSYTSYHEAEDYAHKAAALFTQADIPLWVTQCNNLLGQIAYNQGRIQQAENFYRLAAGTVQQFEIYGLRADYTLNLSKMVMLRGDFAAALDGLKEAEQMYAKVGSPYGVALAAMYQGEAHLLGGRYQLAVQYFERAQAYFQEQEVYARLAECEHFLAEAWLQLGDSSQADRLFNQAITHAQRADTPAFLGLIYNQLARLYLHQQEYPQARQTAQQALDVVQTHGIEKQIPVSRLYLGEALCALGDRETGLAHLEQAQAAFRDMGMTPEQAYCQAALGRVFAGAGDHARARQAYHRAVALSEEVMPQLAWQAQAGLAALAEHSQDERAALECYRQAIASLTALRGSIWQPALAGGFLAQKTPFVDAAVALAARLHAEQDVLQFIEANKAHTLNNYLISQHQQTVTHTPELGKLEAEIRWLQEQLRRHLTSGNLFERRKYASLLQELRQKNRLYDQTKSRLERQNLPGLFLDEHFHLPHFRDTLTAQLGDNWAALDYHFSADRLTGVILTPQEVSLWQTPLLPGVRLVLDLCRKTSRSSGTLAEDDWARLGQHLFPPQLEPYLTPDTWFFIAPHRLLHWVPWAALPIGARPQPLAARCVPLVVPSLFTATLLARRGNAGAASRSNGLLLAVESFDGRHPPLPQVIREMEELTAMLGAESTVLHGEEAAWENLLAIHARTPLDTFAFLHLATHAFSDPFTGRLSGIALYDRDIWNDQLWELAPLPDLVTLSACKGLQSRIYSGDEHVGLAVTCLAAGAQTVVGSLWPVVDADAAHLMTRFYAHFLEGEPPARALALAQREAWQTGQGFPQWGSFLCLGMG